MPGSRQAGLRGDKLNHGWGALPIRVAPALAHADTTQTEGRNKGLWDQRGVRLTQGEAQERLPGGGGLGLTVKKKETLTRL